MPAALEHHRKGSNARHTRKMGTLPPQKRPLRKQVQQVLARLAVVWMEPSLVQRMRSGWPRVLAVALLRNVALALAVEWPRRPRRIWHRLHFRRHTRSRSGSAASGLGAALQVGRRRKHRTLLRHG